MKKFRRVDQIGNVFRELSYRVTTRKGKGKGKGWYDSYAFLIITGEIEVN